MGLMCVCGVCVSEYVFGVCVYGVFMWVLVCEVMCCVCGVHVVCICV